MDDINKELRTEAVLNGLCLQWQGDWLNDKNQDELMEMYKKGIDFCIKNNYPDLSWADKNLDKEIMNNHGVYLNDDIFNVDGGSGRFVVNGECYGLIEFSGIDVSTVYIRNNSNIRINCTGKSIVHVVIYDNATADINQEGESKVMCVLRGKNEAERITGNVKIVDRRKITKRG